MRPDLNHRERSWWAAVKHLYRKAHAHDQETKNPNHWNPIHSSSLTQLFLWSSCCCHVFADAHSSDHFLLHITCPPSFSSSLNYMVNKNPLHFYQNRLNLSKIDYKDLVFDALYYRRIWLFILTRQNVNIMIIYRTSCGDNVKFL